MNPRFIFPPHPFSALKIPPETLHQYEAQGVWLAQRKFNGSHAIIWVYQDQVAMWNRRGIPFSTYRITENMKKCFLYGLNRDYDTEYVFDGELLHTKAKLQTTGKQAVENVVVLFDILFEGKHLSNHTVLDRLDLLRKIAPPGGLEPKNRAFFVTNYGESQIWLAETFFDDFSYHFWEMNDINDKGIDMHPEIEGLMLKSKESKNTAIGTRPNEVNWMVRCRKNKKKLYQF